MGLFGELALILGLAVVLGIIANRLKQPTILGYILAGLAIGPWGYFRLNNLEVLNEFSSIGITLLLFLVGLTLNVEGFKRIGKQALYAGLGQIIFTFGVGFLIVKALGFGIVPAIYISLGLTFSSTIIVVKLLSEKKNLDSLYGKISVGILLIQDFVAVAALIFLSGFFGPTPGYLQLAAAGFKALVIFAAVFFLSRTFFPWFLNRLGRSPELVFLFSMAWGLGLAAFFNSRLIGFSLPIGGLFAGLALANSLERFQISAQVRPIRDFFILFFFVVLGSELFLTVSWDIVWPVIVLSLFVLVGNPLILFFLMNLLGHRARTSFLTSLAMAQISEFSLVLAFLGNRLGHLNSREAALITFVGVATFIASSYFIMYGDHLYRYFRRWLKLFEFRAARDREELGIELLDHMILAGADRLGGTILRSLVKEDRSRFLVVDFNPEVVDRMLKLGVSVVYGDISDVDIQEEIGLREAKAVISTVPDLSDNLSIITYLKNSASKARFIASASNDWEARELYRNGADYVILPHFLGGEEMARVFKDGLNLKMIREMRNRDLALIKN